jgi:hypothetical protein
MAEKPKNSDKFSEYVNTYFQQLTGSSGQKIAPEPFPYISGQKQKLGFLGRTIDLLSRPMRIISNPAMKIVETPERLDKVKQLRASGNEEAANKEFLSTVGGILAAPFTGFFSDDPSNKPYWSDIIERQVDVENRNNPNYVDTADNVNPAVKGALGFVGDVLIDPLWLVPGGWAAKAAKEASRGADAAVQAARGISAAPPVGVAGAVDVLPIGKFKPDMKLFGTPSTYDLKTTIGGKLQTKTFPTYAAAEEALTKLRSRKGARPFVEASKGAQTFRGTNTYSIAPTPVAKTAAAFPSAQAAAKVADDLVENAAKGATTSSETVIKSLREIVDGKAGITGAKGVGLKEEIGGFFKYLSNLTPAAKPGKAQSFEVWSKSLSSDKKLLDTKIQVPPTQIFAANGFGATTTIRNVVDLFKNSRNAELKDALLTQFLRPAYESYKSGVKSGKGVDLLGNASTPTARVQEMAEATIAATIVRNLKNLDDAERARGAALLGEQLFADLQKLSPKEMTKFLDEINVVLYETGAIQGVGLLSDQSLVARFLQLFDVDGVARRAAEEQVARNIDDIPNVTPESTLGAAKKVSESARVRDDVVTSLREAGYNSEQIPVLSDVVTDTLQAVLPGVTTKNINPSSEVYKHVSKTGVKNTKPGYGEGVGVRPGEFSTYSQFDLFLAVSRHIDTTYLREGAESLSILRNAQGQLPKGALLAAEKERLVLTTMKVAENFYLNRGVALTFDLGGVFTQMRFSQAYEAIKQSLETLGLGKKWIRLVFFNGKSGMAPTQFMEAVSKVLAGGSKEDVLQLITAVKDSRTGKDITKVNFLARPNEKAVMGGFRPTSKQAADSLADGIVAARESLEAISIQNAKNYAALGVAEGKVIAQDVIDAILSLVNNPTEFASAVRATAYSGAVVQDFAKAINATQLGATLAAGTVKAGLGEAVTTGAKLVDDLAAAGTSMDPKKIAAAQGALYDDAAQNAQRLLDEARRVAKESADELAEELKFVTDHNIARPLDGVSTEGYGSVMAFLLKVTDPLRRIFDGKYGMQTKELLWGSRMFYATMNTLSWVNKPYLKSLKELMRNNDFAQPVVAGSKTSVLQQAVRNVQQGVKSAEGSVLRNAEDQVRPMLTRFFDMSDDMQNVLLGNAFFRTGAGWESINSVLAYNNVTKTPPGGVFFDFDLALANATKTAKTKGAPTQDEIMQAMLEQWRTWEIDDPINFLYTTNRAMVQLSAEVGFVTGFKKKAIETGVGSYVPKKGFVKITVDGDSRYGKFLGDQPFYMTPEGAEMFQAIDNLAKSSKQFDGGFGKFVKTTLDPITDTWKYAITLPRLGHHIRNMVGDMTLTYLAEGLFGSAAASRKAWQMMAFRGNYSDVDMAKAMSFNGITEIPKSDKIMSSGQMGSFSAEEIWQKLIIERGVLIPARQSEGLLKAQGLASESALIDEVVTTKASRALEKGLAVTSFGLAARGGKMENMWTGLSEGRDSYVRLHHALQLLEKAQAGKTITRGYGTVVDPKKLKTDELFDIIAERVSKYHPDMSTLSIAEKKFFRRAMPFYHWNRGAIQAVTETLLMNPGRIVAFNKASYNLAIANGLNPDSLYDPFPDDQLFPSFLQNQMEGPVFEADGRYFGIRPGIASFDVMNQFASGNPLDTFLDNANPAFKIPIELLTGTRLGTQSRIRDYSDFIDSSIPGFNYAANISGQSVTGSFYSLLTGGGFDPQYQFEVGNKDSRDQMISAVNWLLGIGLTDYSRPSYIRFAQQEQQRANREQRGF